MIEVKELSSRIINFIFQCLKFFLQFIIPTNREGDRFTVKVSKDMRDTIYNDIITSRVAGCCHSSLMLREAEEVAHSGYRGRVQEDVPKHYL